MNKKFRWHALSCTAVLAVMPSLAFAQSDEAAAQISDTTGEGAAAVSERDIVVTGTRIRRDGYDAPVPVTVLGTEEINAQKPANIADLVNTLPAASPSSLTSANSSTSISSGNAGLNTVNLRGLGSARTLVLLNGQRTTPSTFSGFVDVNTFPQDLIERVEVVTGGASAQYGSDAVGGIINFILDEDFKGVKLGADTSITTYGDGPNYRFTATAGASFLEDRLHILLNGEYFEQKGIDTIDRPWNDSGYQWIRNPAYASGNGKPEYFIGSGIWPSNKTSGGIIVSGPLMGTYFLDDGVTGQLNYGTVSGAWMIGGDGHITSPNGVGTATLIPHEKRMGVFSRVSFDVTPDINVYGQFSWNRWSGQGHFGTDQDFLTIKADNGFLLTEYPQVATAMAANGLTSIDVNAWGLFFPGSDNRRNVFRYVAGAKGNLSLFDRPWSWDLFFQHGVTKTREEAVDSTNTDRFVDSLDTVLSNGQIACRSTLTDPSNGCVPMDWLGSDSQTEPMLAYLFGPYQPWREQTFKQDVVSATFSGELFDLPGGRGAMAFGGEWRKDQVHSEVAPRVGSGWFYGNYRVNRGSQNVKEAFLEVALPLFTGFSLDVAGRYTDYSTSGSVHTWKVGTSYSPITDVRFRGSYSHDIRAPNLAELFDAGASSRNVVDPPGPDEDVSVLSITTGNPNLEPEKANTWTVGAVVSPSFLPGFSASVDYWNIKVKDAIGNIGSSQRIIDFCVAGISQFCESLVYGSNGQLESVRRQPVNFASQHATGIDFEASYRTPLSRISSTLPGSFRIHAGVTHNIKNVLDNLIFPVDNAGVIVDGNLGNSFASPKWVYRVSAFYELERFVFNLVGRGFSSGVYSNEWIECTSNCPASTIQNRTVNNNHIDGALYFDGSLTVKFPTVGHDTRLTFVVNNIFNRDPGLVGLDFTGDAVAIPQTARPAFDAIGRVFRVALTSKF